MAKPKYKDKLARPITPGLVELVQHGSFENWIKSDRVKRKYLSQMLELLEHYQIDPSSSSCWFQLAFELACEHEKGFTITQTYKGPGRPKKQAVSKKTKKQRGRPRMNTLEDAKELVRCVEDKKELLKQEKGGHITDKETLTHLLTHYLHQQGTKGITDPLAKLLPRYQRDLSEARRKIRENTKK